MKILFYHIESDFPQMGTLVSSTIHANGRTGLGEVEVGGITYPAALVTNSSTGESRWFYWN